VKSDLLAKTLSFDGIPQLALAGFSMVEQLFDHVPETVFFLKDIQGRYLAVNQTLVERCGLREKRELLGKHVKDIFPRELAERYTLQDQEVLQRGDRIIDKLELHWHERRRAGWCLTTKLPLKDERGKIIGLIGISRDLRSPGSRETIPASLAATMEYLETHYADSISPSSLARHASLSTVRFARLTKRIFRLTPHQLIVQTRLNAAARLLAESDSSVAQIAVDCGFYDHSAFTRAFRSATDLTPSQFREMRQ
jgi:PAS domain S-box-containing protein